MVYISVFQASQALQSDLSCNLVISEGKEILHGGQDPAAPLHAVVGMTHEEEGKK